jgi:AbrB family looped-hinge helix DNA binding protein
MQIATVSSKGQITLPARSRKALGLKPRDRVWVHHGDGAIVIRKAPDLFELEGFLGKAGTLEEEQAALEEAVARHVLGKE